MCGICGIVGPGVDKNIAQAMNTSLTHRGPDREGLYLDEGVVLGNRRLSIIDLITGDQPIANEDKHLWVVHNGEIYNFLQLRKQLESQGHHFRTNSDTEVLVHGYEEWGLDFLPLLDGIFAFALWDIRERRLLLVRDYFGVKPLHYHFDGQTLRFGSEIKALLMDPGVDREVDHQALHFFLNLRYIPGERTLFRGIHRLPPAHYLLFEKGEIHIRRYYELKPQPESQKTEEYYIQGIRYYLREAIRKQMVSDVPLGVYLSGGLDSSSIVALMSRVTDQPVKTFTMGFNEPTDELEDAHLIAQHFNTEHHAITVQPDPLREFPAVIWHAEEPKENILQGYLLSRFACQHVKVVLGGLGGDELFAGYVNNQYIYPSQPFHRLTSSWMSEHLLTPLSRLAFSLQQCTGLLKLDEYRRGVQLLCALGDPQRYYLILRNVWDHDPGMWGNLYGSGMLEQALAQTGTQFKRYFESRDQVLKQVLWAEFNTKMVEDFLANEDRTSMAHGVEVRVPFLDRELVEFAFSIPPEIQMKANRTKYLFRKAMCGILPESTLLKKKWGFSFNPYFQFQKDLKDVAQRILTPERVEGLGLFNYSYVHKILNHPPHPRLRWHYFYLWNLVGFHIWHELFIRGDVKKPAFELEAYFS
ncbi:MAG: asparagine synthase (glutamine-hydrolyzing) [Chloroflexota bacterium]